MEMREGSKILQILATDKDYLLHAPRYIISTRFVFQTQSATLQKFNTTFFLFRFADLALSGHDHVSLCNVLTWG